jgi:hypothetical protein
MELERERGISDHGLERGANGVLAGGGGRSGDHEDGVISIVGGEFV